MSKIYMLYYWGWYPFKRLTIIQKYHVRQKWLTNFPLFIKKDHNYSSFTNGGNNIITSWGCVSFKHLGAGSPTVRLILLMELLSKLAIDGVLTQATQCLLFFPSILTSHWLKDMGYKFSCEGQKSYGTSLYYISLLSGHGNLNNQCRDPMNNNKDCQVWQLTRNQVTHYN